jgi:RHS repeat-associated protein
VGNVTSSTDFLGHRTTAAYDALNRATVATDPLGHSVTTAYDKAGNATTVTDALSKVTSYAYDALNRLLASTDPLGHVATQVVDAAGDAIASVDPLGNYARAVYDQLHRAIGSLDLRGGYTQTGLDGAGGTTSVTDSVGNATGYVNDSLGRQSVATDPAGAKTTTTYDAAGNVSTITDRDGRQQVFHYDTANRLTGATWLSSGGVTVNLLTYTYDSNNNQLTAADFHGAVTSAYDALNRLTAQTDVFGLALTYSYDASSRVTLRSDSKGGVLTYVYDNADRLTSEKLTGSGSAARVDLGYDNRNELTSLTRFADVAGSNLVGTTVYSYDDAQRLTSIVNKTGAATTLSYYQYTLDNAGRSTQEAWQSQNTTGGVVSGTHTYAYDATSQLTAADGTVYNWDLNGNSTNAGKQTGSANRLTNDGTYTYTYDAQGNLTQQSKGSGLETWYYGYNTLNQLTSVRETTDGTTNELTVTYTYDVLNRRVEEDRWATGGTVTVTRTAYDAGGVAWADLNGSNTVQTRYLAGPGTNQWFAQVTSGGDQWLLDDRLGSIRDLVGSGGTTVLDHTEYGAFGAVTSDTSASAASLVGFQGERQDRAAHEALFGDRTLNTTTAQFQQEDWTQIAAGDGNYRRPMGNNPTNATDPTGLNVILLFQPIAAADHGHLAVLIGNEDNGWEYRSFEPTVQGEWESKGKLVPASFKTLEEARKSGVTSEYVSYLEFKSNAEGDAKAVKAADGYDGKKWVRIGDNCVACAVAAIHAAGIEKFQLVSSDLPDTGLRAGGWAGEKMGSEYYPGTLAGGFHGRAIGSGVGLAAGLWAKEQNKALAEAMPGTPMISFPSPVDTFNYGKNQQLAIPDPDIKDKDVRVRKWR